MAVPAWFWPPSGKTARGNSLAQFGGGLAVPDWTTPTLWPFSGGAMIAGRVLATGTPGLSAASTAASGGVWATAYTDTMWEIPPSGPGIAHPLTSGEIYVGCAFAPFASGAYALNSSGTVRSSANAAVGAFASAGIGLAASGGTLFSPIPSLSGIGTMTVPAGTTGLIALPAAMLTPTSIYAASGRSLLAGGYVAATPLSGAAEAVLNPADPTRMLAVGAGRAILWTTSRGSLSDSWTQNQSVTGTATLNDAVWVPNGVQALATSVVSGAMQVFNYSAGTLSLAQTLTLSGATAVAAGDSTNALVVQSGSASVAFVSASIGVWASGVAFTGLTGAVAVTAYGSGGAAAVAYSGGLALTTLVSAGVWTAPVLVPLPYGPSILAADEFGQLYAAASGFMSVVSGTTVVGSGTLPAGTPIDIVAHNGRVCVAIPSASAIYVMGLTSVGTWTQQGSAALGLGAAVGLGLSQTTLFVMGSGSTVTLGFSGSPYQLSPVLAGAIGQWDGASWTTIVMGPGLTPSAVTYDASGNAWVATLQNDLWSVSGNGSVLTSGVIAQQIGQAQTVPLGASAILAASGQIFVATSMPGMLIEAA